MAPQGPPPGGDKNRENLMLKGKLNALSAIIRLGHEAFEKPDFRQLASHIVNNSVLAMPYYRSSLIDIRHGGCRLAAVSGVVDTKQNSEYALEILKVVKFFQDTDKVTLLAPELLEEKSAPQEIVNSYEYLASSSQLIFFVPLRSSGAKGDGVPVDFIWVVEFDKPEQKSAAPAILALLAENYSESLFTNLHSHRAGRLKQYLNLRSWLKPSRILLILFIAFVLASIFGHVRQTVAADFIIQPDRRVITYSPFDAVVATVHVRNGDRVSKGDLILTFDMEERSYNLEAARSEYNKASAELDAVERASFRDPNKRSEVEHYKLRKERSAIEIERNEWYLAKSEIRAETDGVVDIGNYEKLEGKAVRAGELLFEILEKGKMTAEVFLDERNASVLDDETSIRLYLHTRPEIPISTRIISVAPKPILTEQKTYCYIIDAEIEKEDQLNLSFGMRGVARVSGERVTLGYYLFRHMVLWYRQL